MVAPGRERSSDGFGPSWMPVPGRRGGGQGFLDLLADLLIEVKPGCRCWHRRLPFLALRAIIFAGEPTLTLSLPG